MGSSPSSTRAMTSSSSSCRSAGSAISSHVRGAATVGRAFPRSEYGLTVVFFPLFWLQSMNTRPVRSAFAMTAVMLSGCARCRCCARVLATLVTAMASLVPSRPAYRWMPLDPEVTGTQVSPMSSRISRHISATSAVSCNSTPGPGSRSSTSRSGFCGLPSAPKRHCGVCSSSAATWESHARVAEPSISGYALTLVVCWMVPVGTHAGAESSRSLRKKLCLSTPSGHLFLVTGRHLTCGTSTSATAW